MQRFSSWLGVKFSPCICSHGLIGCMIFRNPAVWNVNFKWSSLWYRLLKSKDYKVQWTVTVFFLMHTLQCRAIVLSLGPFRQLKERPGLHCLHMCKYTRIWGIYEDLPYITYVYESWHMFLWMICRLLKPYVCHQWQLILLLLQSLPC